ncbi:hypothetical protein ACRARG_15340 [Pseudooceanicola sp. C21-150M6]|uniref:hypothetical protein n=1 Tax=Pseudooceanicola sp. C21-150M6 TaxID=3434355 RepID=UPI003D7F56D7
MTPPAPEEIERLFTREDGTFHFSRWGHPIVPVIFGVEEASLPPLKGAIEAVVLAAGHRMAEVDPELGTNLMVFFLKDWEELTALDNLDRLVPELDALVPRLIAADASQYRLFRFDQNGAIRAAFVFLRMTGDFASRPAEEIGLELAVKAMLDWSVAAFAQTSPLVQGGDGIARLRPDISAVLRAAYDPVLPDDSRNPAIAFRILARAMRNYG